MALYTELVAKVGRHENVLGWYHSHPGYGCWLSGIDVSTQHTNQTYQEPFVAIVIDPTRTVSYGRGKLNSLSVRLKIEIVGVQKPPRYEKYFLNATKSIASFLLPMRNFGIGASELHIRGLSCDIS